MHGLTGGGWKRKRPATVNRGGTAWWGNHRRTGPGTYRRPAPPRQSPTLLRANSLRENRRRASCHQSRSSGRDGVCTRCCGQLPCRPVVSQPLSPPTSCRIPRLTLAQAGAVRRTPKLLGGGDVPQPVRLSRHRPRNRHSRDVPATDTESIHQPPGDRPWAAGQCGARGHAGGTRILIYDPDRDGAPEPDGSRPLLRRRDIDPLAADGLAWLPSPSLDAPSWCSVTGARTSHARSVPRACQSCRSSGCRSRSG
jgi:hypothetical protein